MVTKLNIFSFISFCIIALLFHTGLTTAFDNSVYSFVSLVISDTMTTFMILITNLGGTVAIVLICLGLLILPKTRISFGVPVTITAICSSSLNSLLKILFSRERPDILCIIEVDGYSFPSGHSMNNMAIYTVVVLLILTFVKDDFKKQIFALSIFILPITIGFSRIYLGVHYPSDVLAGLFAGFWVGSLVFIIFERRKLRQNK